MKQISLNPKILLLMRYIFIAGLVYLIDMGVYVSLLFISLTPVPANIIAKILATIFGFFGHRFFTYQIRGNKNILMHAVKFTGLFLLYIPVSSLLLVFMIKVLVNPVISKFICDIILVILTCWLNSKFTFLQPDMKKDEISQ